MTFGRRGMPLPCNTMWSVHHMTPVTPAGFNVEVQLHIHWRGKVSKIWRMWNGSRNVDMKGYQNDTPSPDQIMNLLWMWVEIELFPMKLHFFGALPFHLLQRSPLSSVEVQLHHRVDLHGLKIDLGQKILVYSKVPPPDKYHGKHVSASTHLENTNILEKFPLSLVKVVISTISLHYHTCTSETYLAGLGEEVTATQSLPKSVGVVGYPLAL